MKPRAILDSPEISLVPRCASSARRLLGACRLRAALAAAYRTARSPSASCRFRRFTTNPSSRHLRNRIRALGFPLRIPLELGLVPRPGIARIVTDRLHATLS
jgi:hypothetical protein